MGRDVGVAAAEVLTEEGRERRADDAMVRPVMTSANAFPPCPELPMYDATTALTALGFCGTGGQTVVWK
jgi:hypothetical protein